MLGFVGISSCKVAGSKFQLIVISRRSRFNAGVRLQTRGLDNEGNAANFVETEQIIEFGDAMTSLVEVTECRIECLHVLLKLISFFVILDSWINSDVLDSVCKFSVVTSAENSNRSQRSSLLSNPYQKSVIAVSPIVFYQFSRSLG